MYLKDYLKNLRFASVYLFLLICVWKATHIGTLTQYRCLNIHCCPNGTATRMKSLYETCTGCPKKKYTDSVDPSNENIARINPKKFSKHTLIANLHIDTLFFISVR